MQIPFNAFPALASITSYNSSSTIPSENTNMVYLTNLTVLYITTKRNLWTRRLLARLQAPGFHVQVFNWVFGGWGGGGGVITAGMEQWWEHSPPTKVARFDSQPWSQMWVGFVGYLLCSEWFFSGYSGFSPLLKYRPTIWYEFIWFDIYTVSPIWAIALNTVDT